jgi:hypothetical protein
MRILGTAALLVAFLFPMAGELSGQSNGEVGRAGIGFQSSWPAYGISGTYDLNQRLTGQAVVGAFGTLSTFSARGLYHFQREEKYSLFGYGTAGVWRHSFRILGTSDSETSPGLGGGAGIELNWRGILDGNGSGNASGFPPLFSSIDLGFVAASFDNYNFSGMVIGAGLHYRF